MTSIFRQGVLDLAKFLIYRDPSVYLELLFPIQVIDMFSVEKSIESPH